MALFPKKLVAVVNEKIEIGKAMNALAHMTLGLGANIENKDELRFTNYKDKDGGNHDKISEMPFMILKANSNQIRTLRKAALANNMNFVDFNNTMTEGTYEDQIKRANETKEELLEYYGIILFGDWELVSDLTRKFSLWK
ncbi:DUF2000 domain-containing protein [Candidatus Woesearchaeota archaeon]|nr:DUF2000 domain-containing protein [Candidatus Woesearchaeota archaeon]